MKLATALLLTLTALAQDMPDLRGTVTEFGTNAPIAGAEVILSEFVTIDNLLTRKPLATILTDSRGAFTLKPEHPGSYYVEAKKPSYLSGEELDALGPKPGNYLADMPLDITRERVPDIHFILIRPGGLTGRVIDEDGKPVPNFRVTTGLPGVPESLSAKAVTDENGVFTFETLVPTPRVIRAGHDDDRSVAINSDFKQEDIDKIVEDIETGYWPGGVTDPALALPINVIPGNIANAGTIRIRKAPYYRALLTFGDQCQSFTIAQVPIGAYFPDMRCDKDLLIEKLSPGKHDFALWVGGAAQSEITQWAFVSFTIDRKNIEVSVIFTKSVDIPGRMVNANGGNPPNIGNSGIQLLPVEGRPSRLEAKPDARGEFTIRSVPWPRHQVRVGPVPPGLAIKEIRYNNQPSPDGFIDVASGAPLEIVLDDQPATITGFAPPQSRVYVFRWPSTGVMTGAPYAFITTTDAKGAFRAGSLAAGEYRVIAVAEGTPFIEPPTLTRLLAASPKITLERGAQLSLELKLSDPTR